MGTQGQGRRAWKLQENVAHGSNVTCLALGPSSGRVMVTGGEDRKVNLWAIGKPQEIMSLSGHTSPVESVQFNGTEELVVAGSQSGTLKIWDLEAAKIVRTLTGHKSSIKSLDFHPYGDFVASGSLDTNIKLWDVRRKGCIFTYKGHTGSINHIRFSPDGRWVVSAGDDGIVKLWDLTAGKILNDFKSHTAAVNRVEFHPKEFLLASGGADRTVKFLDLETFELVSSTEPEPTAVRCIGFHPEGVCLFSGSQDSLRLHGWEPSRCYEALSVGWGKVSDIAFSSDQLIGASFSQTNVAVWVVDLAHVEAMIERLDKEEVTRQEENAPVSKESASDVDIKPVQGFRKASPQRRAFDTRPRTQSSKQRKGEKGSEEGVNDDLAVDEKYSNLPKPDHYDKVFTPSQTLARSPQSSRRHVEPFVAPPEPNVLEDIKINNADSHPAVMEVPLRAPYEPPKPANPVVSSPPTVAVPPYSSNDKDEHPPFKPPPKVGPSYNPPQEPLRPQHPQVNALPSGQPHYRPPITPVVAPVGEDRSYLLAQQQMRDLAVREPAIVGHDLHHGHPIAANPELDEDRAIRTLGKSHESICTIMNTRLKNLTAVGQLWTDGEIKGAVEAAANMPDHAVLVDLLNVLILKQTLWTLDICVVVLPRLIDMLSSKYESYVETGCNSLKVILKNFAPVIKSNMAAPPAAIGVDLVREERYNKCQMCYSHLKHVQDFANKANQIPGRLGGQFREVCLALTVLD